MKRKIIVFSSEIDDDGKFQAALPGRWGNFGNRYKRIFVGEPGGPGRLAVWDDPPNQFQLLLVWEPTHKRLTEQYKKELQAVVDECKNFCDENDELLLVLHRSSTLLHETQEEISSKFSPSSNTKRIVYSHVGYDDVYNAVAAVLDTARRRDNEGYQKEWEKLVLLLAEVERQVRKAAFETVEAQWAYVLGIEKTINISDQLSVIQDACNQASVQFPPRLKELFSGGAKSIRDVKEMVYELFGKDGSEPEGDGPMSGLLEQLHGKIHGEGPLTE